MEAERWQQVEQLLQSVLELEEQQRAEFLRQACAGNEDLRREVESLLLFGKDAENFIETPALEEAAEALAIENQGSSHVASVDVQALEGKTVSHYRVLEKLGGGGMGIVYKARDTKLGRVVALKFLPSNLAQDREAIERFRREAYAASALNHPHICTIYDIDEYQAAPFIAMEFLAGQTLKQCIAGRPLPVNQLVDVGIQVSRALDAAHDQGIIHRDIKPANVFISNDGIAKILDFGVAKLVGRSSETVAASITAISASLHDSMTVPGTLMGTLAYMSPEQIRGDELDTRADLFSFGVVLYEMASGRKPFVANSTVEIVDAILRATPAPLAELNPTVPPQLQEVINKCLEKDRNLRYQHAADIRTDLQSLKRDTDSGPRIQVIADGWAGRKRGWTRVAGVVTALCFLAAAGYGIYTLVKPSRTTAFQNFTVTQETDSGKVALAAISPDGKYLLSVISDKGQESLWLRNLPTGSETQVLPLSEAVYLGLMFSPDSNYIYYLKASNNAVYGLDLYRAPVLGGTPQLVARDALPISFSPDGTRLAFPRWNDPEDGKYQLLTVKPDGTDEQVLHNGPYYPRLLSVAWSPDGRSIACAFEHPGDSEGGIDMFDLASRHMRPFVRFDDKIPSQVTWLSDESGLLLQYEGKFTHSGRLQIGFVSYPRGEFRSLTNDTNSYQQFTLSADGKILATVQEQIASEIDVLPGSGDGTPATLPGIARQAAINDVNWAGNGHFLLSEDTRLVEVAVDGSNPVNLFNDPSARIQSAAACAEGRSIVFSAFFHGTTSSRNVWRADPDGFKPQKLSEGKVDVRPVCAPNGESVYFTDGAVFRVKRVSILGGRVEEVPGTAIPLAVFFPVAVSPDGKLLAYIPMITSPATHTTTQKLAVVNLAVSSQRKPSLVDVDPRVGAAEADISIQFTPDGKAVAYVIEEHGVDNIWTQPLDGSQGHQLTNFTSQHIAAFHWSPDGRSLALLRTDVTHDAILLRTSDR